VCPAESLHALCPFARRRLGGAVKGVEKRILQVEARCRQGSGHPARKATPPITGIADRPQQGRPSARRTGGPRPRQVATSDPSGETATEFTDTTGGAWRTRSRRFGTGSAQSDRPPKKTTLRANDREKTFVTHGFTPGLASSDPSARLVAETGPNSAAQLSRPDGECTRLATRPLVVFLSLNQGFLLYSAVRRRSANLEGTSHRESRPSLAAFTSATSRSAPPAPAVNAAGERGYSHPPSPASRCSSIECRYRPFPASGRDCDKPSPMQEGTTCCVPLRLP